MYVENMARSSRPEVLCKKGVLRNFTKFTGKHLYRSLFFNKVVIGHGTIIRTGITCKKITCYMRDSACRWLIVENAKIFQSYVKHFLIFPREKNCRIFIGLYK